MIQSGGCGGIKTFGEDFLRSNQGGAGGSNVWDGNYQSAIVTQGGRWVQYGLVLCVVLGHVSFHCVKNCALILGMTV